ncbi:lysophospholipid acyltransferase family protein [Duganella guangzhouensis]|nr:lysophospholipid acyltransferase family protein [Duganella guangzhouensis]
MSTLHEWPLQWRLRLAQAQLKLSLLTDDEGQRQFEHAIASVFPALSASERRQLYGRHRRSMRAFHLIQSHLTQFDAAQLEDFITRHVQVEGESCLEQLRDNDKPIIFVTPHYGTFQLGCLKVIQQIGRRKTVNAFYNPPSVNQSSAGFEELFQRLGYGFNTLFNDDSAVLRALRVLRRGEALTMMPDVFDISGHALYVPFFGRLVPAMAGTALFALKSEATVVVGYSCPGQGLDSTVRLGAPLTIQRSGNLETDIATLTAAIFRDIEAQIRRAPEHWMYLPSLGELLQTRLPVTPATAQDWLARLQVAAPIFNAAVPELPQLLQTLASHTDHTLTRNAPCAN